MSLLLTLIFATSLTAGCGAQPSAEAGRAAPAGAAKANSAPARANAGAVATPQTDGRAAADAVVKDLYQQAERKSPFFQTDDRALVEKFFTKETAGLIWKDAVESEGEVGALGANPLYDAQDTEIKNFSVAAPEVKGTQAEVKVSFQNFGKKVNITYLLANADGGWKISDIRYAGGRTLVGMLKGEGN